MGLVENCHDLDTTVNYYNDPGDGSPPTPVYVGSTKVTNERPMIATPMTVYDITGDEAKYTLDSHGFQYHRHESREKGFHDEDQLKTDYLPECEQVIKEVTGATRVVVFDHKVRRGPSYWHKLGENNTKSRGPLHRAHVDQSYDGAAIQLRRVFADDEADEIMKRRWQIINIWRPIKPVHKDPLAVGDAGSIPDTDLVAAHIIYPGWRAESWTIKANPSHRWHYKHAQEPDEVVLIKCFDSRTDVARRSPHCAVEDPAAMEAESRESVEVRCLVIYDA